MENVNTMINVSLFRLGEVTCLSIIIISPFNLILLHDRWGDPPHVTSPIWGPPSPCKQALRIQLLDKSRTRLHLTNYASWIHRREVSRNANSLFKRRFRHRC